MGAKLDLAGRIFGKLRAIQENGRDAYGKVLWNCECTCGEKITVRGSSLYTGRVKSCGCLRLDKITTHGMARSKTYRVWEGIIQRCLNQKDTTYKFYGGRGIGVCERWMEFKNFYKDMGERPCGASIERIDNNSGYGPDNCRWTTMKEQSHNRRCRNDSPFAISGVGRKREKYRARITVDGKDISLGVFKNIDEAAEARKEAEKRYWGANG